MKIEPTRKGESLQFVFDRRGLSTEGWECNIVVKQYPDDTALLFGPVEKTNGIWKGFLTAAQTDTLESGKTYRLYGILTNSSTDEEEQIETRFSLTASWAA